MSTTSVKPVPTLKGIFNVPKMNHRRDFLRENKLSLRELQRVTNKNKTSIQLEQTAKVQRQRDQHQQQQDIYVGRRSASQQRPQLTGVAAAMQQTSQRSISEKRQYKTMPQPRPTQPQTNILQQPLQRRVMQQQQQQQQQCASYSARGNRRGSLPNGSICTVGSVVSRAESCDKQIQTEDIQDEVFLYDALKKCASSESNAIQSAKAHATNDMDRVTISDPNVPLSNGHYGSLRIQGGANETDKQSYYPHDEDDASVLKQSNSQHEDFSRQNHQQQNLSEDNPATDTNRTQGTALNGFVHSPPTDEELSTHLGHLALEQAEPPLSGRSRQTVFSTQSHDDGTVVSLSKKRSTGSLHKLGSREDVRLPRYLEREKREKEELRIRAQERDPNCPIGHFALTEQERKAAMAMAEKKFKGLINELNHMPITTETLRIRNRKAEIEKELTTIEADIRIFSKPKVYVKEQNNYV